ncbi:MAG TPA: hypothetical protein VHT70_05080 [Candidatus Saccharimonadales bacterium]|jgi:hypothetical protein|nr:hypothetical protein [Candidatus Saccharimonadales bacterium]
MKEAISNPAQQTPELSVGSRAVEAGKQAYRKYVSAQDHLREDFAQEIIEAGGDTQREPFLYTMHGIVPDAPLTEKDQRILDTYKRLEKKFYPGVGGQPFVRLRQFDDRPADVDDGGVIATPPVDKDGNRVSPLHYKIEPGMHGYDGQITIPVTQHHIAPYPLGFERDDDCTLTVAHVEKSYDDEVSTGITNYGGSFVIGLEAIYGARRMGDTNQQTGDDNYLDIARTLGNAAQEVRERFAFERQQEE